MIEKSATISACGKYRYSLRRKWDASKESALFIMLNPSTADADSDDATIRKCVKFAKRWGYGGITVLNLFAYRATNPKELWNASDPVGEDNMDHFRQALSFSGAREVICAWGVNGYLMDQDLTVLGWLECWGSKSMALRISKDGHPWHPLYIPDATDPIAFEGRKG